MSDILDRASLNVVKREICVVEFQSDESQGLWRTDPLSLSSAFLPQCVDLSCNELTEVTLPETLPPKLQELDLTGNPRLNLDHKSLELLK